MPTSTLYHYLHPDGRLKRPGRELLGVGREEEPEPVPGADAGAKH